MEPEEIINEIDQLNAVIHDLLNDDDAEYQLNYETNGSSARIVFMGITIWDDQDNQCEWIGGDEGDYTPLDVHLKERMKAVIGRVALIAHVIDGGDA